MGPIVTLVFALLGYAVIPYGAGLSLSDMELGILFMLAVSSLATYGILLAGFSNRQGFHFFRSIIYILNLAIRNIPNQFTLFVFPSPSAHMKNAKGQGYLSNKLKPRFIVTKTGLNYNTYPLQHFNISYSSKILKVLYKAARCFIHTNGDKNNSNINKEQCIQDLFKDRIAPVIPFDRNLIKGSCLNYTDKICKAKFLKKWVGYAATHKSGYLPYRIQILPRYLLHRENKSIQKKIIWALQSRIQQ